MLNKCLPSKISIHERLFTFVFIYGQILTCIIGIIAIPFQTNHIGLELMIFILPIIAMLIILPKYQRLIFYGDDSIE